MIEISPMNYGVRWLHTYMYSWELAKLSGYLYYPATIAVRCSIDIPSIHEKGAIAIDCSPSKAIISPINLQSGESFNIDSALLGRLMIWMICLNPGHYALDSQ